MTRPETDKTALREALGAFATGVTIVTARASVRRSSASGTLERGEPVGFTANSFTSVSLEPPLLLVCLAHTAASYKVFCESESFAVNVLAADQQQTAMLFATRGADKFGTTRWHSGLMGAPLIEGCLARFDCAMHQRVAAGDHDVIMGRVIDFSRHEGEALLYHGGAFQRLG
jgi:flavin reductase (DIM6/NTAB) family NADH-FMN oxidoreductase RutF